MWRRSALSGARRFVFFSSVKAMAEPGDECVDEDWPGEPATAYGRSKRAAEAAVLATGARNMACVWRSCAWRLFMAAAGAGRLHPRLQETVERLLGSACYSPARIERELGWRARGTRGRLAGDVGRTMIYADSKKF